MHAKYRLVLLEGYEQLIQGKLLLNEARWRAILLRYERDSLTYCEHGFNSMFIRVCSKKTL